MGLTSLASEIESPRRRRVLVVEDDEELRGLILANLGAHGFDAWGVADVVEFLGLFKELEGKHERPDVLVLDVHLPFFSGLELFRMMRRAQWEMPVIVISGACDRRVEQTAQDLGAKAILQKPFALATLRAVIAA